MTARATAVSSLSRWMRNWPKFTFWTTKPNLTYINQLWAEAMTIYNSGNYKLAFSPAMQEMLQAHQQDFMQEDAQAGLNANL